MTGTGADSGRDGIPPRGPWIFLSHQRIPRCVPPLIFFSCAMRPTMSHQKKVKGGNTRGSALRIRGCVNEGGRRGGFSRGTGNPIGILFRLSLSENTERVSCANPKAGETSTADPWAGASSGSTTVPLKIAERVSEANPQAGVAYQAVGAAATLSETDPETESDSESASESDSDSEADFRSRIRRARHASRRGVHDEGRGSG